MSILILSEQIAQMAQGSIGICEFINWFEEASWGYESADPLGRMIGRIAMELFRFESKEIYEEEACRALMRISAEVF